MNRYATLFTTKGYRPVLGTRMNRMEQREQRVNAVGKGYRPVPDTIDVLEGGGVNGPPIPRFSTPRPAHNKPHLYASKQKGF